MPDSGNVTDMLSYVDWLRLFGVDVIARIVVMYFGYHMLTWMRKK